MISDLLVLLFGDKFDRSTVWTAAIALITLIGVLVAWRQLAGIRATSRADFTFPFIESFFTAETRTLFGLLINSALTFEVKEIVEDGKIVDRLPYLKINDGVSSQLAGLVSPPPGETGYSAPETDDLLLGHFESLGWYMRKKLMDFDAARSNFSYYLTTSFEQGMSRRATRFTPSQRYPVALINPVEFRQLLRRNDVARPRSHRPQLQLAADDRRAQRRGCC